MIQTNRLNRYPTPFWGDLDQLFQRAVTGVGRGQGARHFTASESEVGWTLRSDLPGFAKEDVEVSVEEGLLRVAAKATDQNPGFVAGFEQRLELPEQVDRAKITARLLHGVLEIKLPRRPEDQAKEIRIAVD